MPELWLWHKDEVTILVRAARGYRVVAKSQVLPELDLPQLLSFVDRPSTYDVITDYRAALAAASR